MRSSKGKIHLSIITVIICSFAFLVILHTDPSKDSYPRTKYVRKQSKYATAEEKPAKDHLKSSGIDNRIKFNQKVWRVDIGKWVFDHSFNPLYTERSCPYLERQVTCIKNGRQDSDYLRWEWRPDDCALPRFNANLALEKLRGKRLMFVGDSLQRGQWRSFVCLVEWTIPENKKSMKLGRPHSVFKATEYNATIEFYWAPFLVESNADLNSRVDMKKRIMKLDSIAKHGKHWVGVDILVFNTYVWWMTGPRLKTLWGSFEDGEVKYGGELDYLLAYRVGLETWADWIDSNIDPSKTRVFFITMSPTHQRSEDWGKINGTKCFNEKKPILKKTHWGSGSDKRMMSVVASVGEKMRVPVTFINITQLSEYRIDAHTSIYTETRGNLLTEEQKADPLHHADCVHWCLPGLPDTWNQIFLTYLL
ncbi:hypothetical protein Tsubulata_013484 [Turnera subulata]|uniref:Trichome birefringence-like N-terminal domain-containing protein n=1 Tax=Turnera subulata TaxID=218843 RepID=A0A9Q0JDY1_9ROSI|nr:hypothetical protein Tsubulata_013484 [Turnera subulata]